MDDMNNLTAEHSNSKNQKASDIEKAYIRIIVCYSTCYSSYWSHRSIESRQILLRISLRKSFPYLLFD